MAQLKDFARLLRSKNAGPFQLTIDVMLGTAEELSSRHRQQGPDRGCGGKAFGADPKRVRIIHYEPAFAIKVTLPRRVSCGDPLDNDLFGGQLFGPLAQLPMPDLKA